MPYSHEGPTGRTNKGNTPHRRNNCSFALEDNKREKLKILVKKNVFASLSDAYRAGIDLLLYHYEGEIDNEKHQ